VPLGRRVGIDRVVAVPHTGYHDVGEGKGANRHARFAKPTGVAVDGGGGVVVVDSGNHVLRIITKGGTVRAKFEYQIEI
jgi:hypothetical protein